MSVKNVNITYSTNQGTILPGYSHFTNMMGMDGNFDGPTRGFIFGDQKDIREEAVQKSWLVKTVSLNTPFVQTNSQNINLRASVEPIPNLKIELTGLRTQSKSNSEFFKWKNNDTLKDGSIVNHFAHESPIETGNFSMSFLSFSTSFKNGNAVFQNFLDARSAISKRLGAQNDSSLTKINGSTINGYGVGYNPTSQDVLIPAFIAAYSGKSPLSIGLSAFPTIPAPNWRITYDGLSKIDEIKKYFKSITLSNAYTSTYNVGSYASNLLFTPYAAGGEYTGAREPISSIPANPNFLSKDLISTVTISEQWSPLIKVDAVLNNSVLANFEYKKNRNLSLGITSNTITEVAGSEIVVGTGYRLKNLSLGKRLLIKGKPIKSDLNLKCDLSFRQNQTIIREIVEEVSQITAGSNIISIKVSADYVINERINIKLFYDRIINTPVISNSFPTTNTNAGLSLRLSLSN
jgi:cell surface protein SprA